MTNEGNWPLDPWLAASLLQKSIRRGIPELAAFAVDAYCRMRGKGSWRRLVIIAFEDIGIGAPEVVADVTRECTEILRRRPRPSDRATLAPLARRMAAAPKDRSADYLISAVKYHPGWAKHRSAVARLPLQDRIRLAVDPAADLPLRATATWLASGVNTGQPPIDGHSDLAGLMQAFTEAGSPEVLTAAVRQGVGTTREAMTLFLPLLSGLVVSSCADQQPVAREVEESVPTAGLPLWVLDKHTALGKQAISELVRDSDEVRSTLERAVPEFRARDVALMAAFYADAIQLNRKLAWEGQLALEQAGMEADMVSAHCPLFAASEIVEVVRKNLSHLNAIRARLLLARSRVGLLGLDLGEDR